MTALGDVELLVTLPDSDDARPNRQPLEKQPALRGYGGALAAIMALIVVGAVAAALSGQVRHQLALSFTRLPEHYTELFFPGDGPTEIGVDPGRVVISVSFTVASHEGETSRFPYLVQVVDSGEVTLGQARGSVEVPDGNRVTTTVGVEISATQPWSAVDVGLEGRSEHIRFLRTEVER